LYLHFLLPRCQAFENKTHGTRTSAVQLASSHRDAPDVTNSGRSLQYGAKLQVETVVNSSTIARDRATRSREPAPIDGLRMSGRDAWRRDPRQGCAIRDRYW
jgi:hypothetical protein